MTQQIGGSDAATELAGLQPWSDRAPAITASEYQARIARARTLMAQEGLDALLIDAGTSLAYFAGVPWGASERLVVMLLPLTGEPILICPRFERGSLEADLKIDAGDLRLWEEDESPSILVADALKTLGVARLGIDPAMAFLFVERIRAAAPGVTLVAASAVIDGCRSRKSAAELALMQQAKSMTLEVHRRAARILRPGITATEVRRFIEAAHRALGASGSSFCIVQFGRSTAYPHGLPGESVLAEGEMVLIDTGCTIGGYHSDITRSYVYGEADAEQRRIWALEKEAQQAAFDAVKPDYRLPGLPHRTGHGIGLSIHEAPYLVRGDMTPLEPGMCFSNEPMIVVPDRFGVRLEDHFYVTETGAAWFTPPSVAIDQPFA
ncbi:MAG: X-Pro dipeptidase [Sphingobium sp.]|nr:MAG: X-Pro dipeptidase [Sphingobium sp.]